MQQWNKGARHQTAVMSEEGEAIWQDLQEDHRAGDRKANSRVFDWATGNEWLDCGGVAPSKMKETMSKVHPSLKKLWHTFRLLGMNSPKEGATWHVDTLLGNNRELRNYTTVVTK